MPDAIEKEQHINLLQIKVGHTKIQWTAKEYKFDAVEQGTADLNLASLDIVHILTNVLGILNSLYRDRERVAQR